MSTLEGRMKLAMLADKIGKQSKVVENENSTEGALKIAKRNLKKFSKEYILVYNEGIEQGALYPCGKDDTAGIISEDNLIKGSVTESIIHSVKKEITMSNTKANVKPSVAPISKEEENDNISVSKLHKAVELGESIKVKFTNGVEAIYNSTKDTITLCIDGISEVYKNIKARIKEIIAKMQAWLAETYVAIKQKVSPEAVVAS